MTTTQPTPAPGDIQSFSVEGMAYGGKGVARLNGKVFFIPDAIPGDVVQAKVVSDNGRYGEAATCAVMQPSALRSPPRCPVASTCGGCQWDGVAYEQQLAWKRSFVESSLTRIGKLPPDVEVAILPSPALHGYRNRILVRAHLSAEGKLKVGYFRRGTRELVPITGCAIAAPALNETLAALAASDLTALGALTARLELQEIPAQGNGRVVVTIYPSEGPREAMDELAAKAGALPMVYWAGLVFDLATAPAVPFDEDLGRRFLTVPGQFQQVNVAHNHTLRRLVQAHADRTGAARILDVFCGSGNLSLPLADGRRYVEGVEANKRAIAIARQNVEANGIANATYLTGDAEKHLWKCARGGEQFDLVILDPPRQGMYGGMVPLKMLAPEHLIYVSCDPATLARDLGYLCRKDAYRLEAVTALDFFPNTYHVETVAILHRSGKISP
jgi:23S rRNA (uracil1939-C5)-methyltransferase